MGACGGGEPLNALPGVLEEENGQRLAEDWIERVKATMGINESDFSEEHGHVSNGTFMRTKQKQECATFV